MKETADPDRHFYHGVGQDYTVVNANDEYDDESTTPTEDEKITNKRRAYSFRLCALFSALILSLLLLQPVGNFCASKLADKNRAGSSGGAKPESIEQRVKRILTETPLIGNLPTSIASNS